jgi:membrane fusion protein (multidrug efflux system)
MMIIILWLSYETRKGQDMDAVTPEPLVPARRSRLATPRTLAASAVAIAVAVGGALWITATPTSESTDDAYVAADATAVAPKVRGLVAAVLVRDNQQVRTGEPIALIDPEEFDARVQQSHAAILDAEERLAAAETVAARTAIRSADAQSARAVADRRRFDALVAGGAVARRDADAYAAAAVSAEQDAARARALVAVSGETAGVTRAKRAGLLAALQTAQAKVGQARAAHDLALQDRRHTIIRAAIDGTVGNRQVRVGDYVQPGSRLLTLVPLHALYVTANFKETQTARMRPGQKVAIDADALPGSDLHGAVESLAPGSGSSFSLLPFEPGTGNFTKIVQRVGVRIRFDPGQPAVDRLRPGLSVTAKVRLNDR